MQAICWHAIHENMMSELEYVFVALFSELDAFNVIARRGRNNRVRQTHDRLGCCTL